MEGLWYSGHCWSFAYAEKDRFVCGGGFSPPLPSNSSPCVCTAILKCVGVPRSLGRCFAC